ncbi:MAG: hypothetical protein PHQ12_08670 [Chthoniobacteraceae bacterium]|nr:hypothetical protein [Chthoniobacteraceae bacterium]
MTPRLAICTLLEGGYHLGLGPLVNSLYGNGFRGVVWAGIRGEFPPWAQPLPENGAFAEFTAAPDCVVRFVRLDTAAHLTNHKPDFMLRVLEAESPDCAGLFYMDPDVIVDRAWRFFEDWVTCGVAVCEDVNSPFAAQDPRRVGWRRFFAERGVALHPGFAEYANGGVVGVRREEVAFLRLWKRMQDLLWEALGGDGFAGIGGGRPMEGRSGFADCFDKTDQDVLNAALEAAGVPVSFVNRQAMGFAPGLAWLPHALGPSKPWGRDYVREALRGVPPRAVDKAFWLWAERGPVRVFAPAVLRRQRACLRVASALGRVFRRG